MPSKSPTSRSLDRRSILAGAGICSLVGIGALSGSYVIATETDEVDVTRQLSVDDEFDIDDTTLDPAGKDDSSGGEVSQQCDPDPDRIVSRSHIYNLTMIDAWNEDYRIWSENGDEIGVTVQNSVAIEKAPERVHGMLMYGVRLYSLCHVESGRFSQLRLHRLENELTVESEVDIEAVLPSEPIRPTDGTCSLTLMRELPSGWNAGYDQTMWANDGVIDTARDDDTVLLSFDGETPNSVAIEGYLELRSERPITEIDDVFTWTIRGEATRRGL